MNLKDGARGDDDLLANGIIVDPGAAAFNPAPVVDPIAGPETGVPHQSLDFSTDFTDLGNETHLAAIDWGDGAVEQDVVQEGDGGGVAFGSHAYDRPGVYIVSIEVTDEFGNTAGVQTQVFITQFTLLADLLDPQKKILTVGGTQWNDKLSFRSLSRGRTIDAYENRSRLGRFVQSELSRIVVFAGEGTDRVIVDRRINISTELRGGPGNDVIVGGSGIDLLDGGPGNDRLYGSRGNDVLRGGPGNDALVGGSGDDLLDGGSERDRLYGQWGNDILLGTAGNDALYGGSGRDVLIGGADSDRLSGSWGQDVLIGGTTLYDNDDSALASIMALWTSRDSYADRVARLSSPIAAPYLRNGETVLDDGMRDRVFGSLGYDWILP